MKLSNLTISLLNDIENRIDPICENDYLTQWDNYLNRNFNGNYFHPERRKKSIAKIKFPAININDALENYELMLQHQLNLVSVDLDSDRALGMRSNYGSGISTSLYPTEIFTMPYEMNELPTTRSLNDTEKIRELVANGVPSLEGGFGKKVFEMGEIYMDVLERYPKIKKYVAIFHPDMQGPLDTTELLWGGEMFYAMYDQTELVHEMLDIVCKTYIEFLDKWFTIVPKISGINTHWFMRHKGTIFLRNDSAMNISPDLYREFVKPCDAKLLKYYGGGGVHFCGKGDHYISELCDIPDLCAVQISQPHLNDMEIILKNTVDRGILLQGLCHEWAEKLSLRPGGLKGLVQTV